jgi:hypothetical protein
MQPGAIIMKSAFSYGMRAFWLFLALALYGTACAEIIPFDRPFSGTLMFAETFSASASCPGPGPNLPGLQGISSGTGQASHMGNTTFTSTICAAAQSNGAICIVFGQLVATAADGSQAFAMLHGSLNPAGAGGEYTLVGNYRITGGTGRFEDASGEGTLGGSLLRTAGTAAGSLVFNGSISY